jgi:hypothetical protein
MVPYFPLHSSFWTFKANSLNLIQNAMQDCCVRELASDVTLLITATDSLTMQTTVSVHEY